MDLLSQIVFNGMVVDDWINTVMLTIEISGLQGLGSPIISKEKVELCEDGRVWLYLEVGGNLIAEYYVNRRDWAWIL
jgi:hypothetical protein